MKLYLFTDNIDGTEITYLVYGSLYKHFIEDDGFLNGYKDWFEMHPEKFKQL